MTFKAQGRTILPSNIAHFLPDIPEAFRFQSSASFGNRNQHHQIRLLVLQLRSRFYPLVAAFSGLVATALSVTNPGNSHIVTAAVIAATPPSPPLPWR